MNTNMADCGIDIQAWWTDFSRHLADDRAAEIVEVLSDSSNEQYLNAITAKHLRAFGRRACGDRFWARSEWAKTDISYGVAKGPFDDWERAWSAGTTGDVGQIEAKLVYEHFTEATKLAKVQELSRQLEQRRKRDRWPGQQYHGIVWVMQHGSLPLGEVQEPSPETVAALDAGRALDLVIVDGWRQMAQRELPGMWPTAPQYVGVLWACLCRLRDE
jgi:hypothetical protein